MTNSYWLPWRVFLNGPKLSIETNFRGHFAKNNCRRLSCLYCLRFVHSARTERLSRENFKPYVDSRKYVRECHTSCVDPSVPQCADDVINTGLVFQRFPERQPALLLQLRICKLVVRGGQSKTRILGNSLQVLRACRKFHALNLQ